MNLTQGLDLLADEAEPAPVDADEVMAAARTRTRNRRATAATALATVAVVGALTVTLGNTNGPATMGDTTATTTATTAAEAEPQHVREQRAAALTAQLTAAWPGIAPAGVTVAPSTVAAEVFRWQKGPLEFGFQDDPAGNGRYTAYTELSDAQGSTWLSIHVYRAGDDPRQMPFTPCTGTEQGITTCTFRELPDGTKVNVGVQAGSGFGVGTTAYVQALRPDGTEISVADSNALPDQTLSRTEPIMSAEDLVEFATVFTY